MRLPTAVKLCRFPATLPARTRLPSVWLVPPMTRVASGPKIVVVPMTAGRFLSLPATGCPPPCRSHQLFAHPSLGSRSSAGESTIPVSIDARAPVRLGRSPRPSLFCFLGQNLGGMSQIRSRIRLNFQKQEISEIGVLSCERKNNERMPPTQW